MVHVCLMQLVLEYSEEGSTQILSYDRLERVLQLLRLLMGFIDEARKRDLKRGKRFASLTSIVVNESIAETLGHETYVKFLGRRARGSEVHLWHHERRACPAPAAPPPPPPPTVPPGGVASGVTLRVPPRRR